MAASFLAFDLGAENGRGVVGTVEDGVLRTEAVRRFPNRPFRLGGSISWNVASLFDEMREGMAEAARRPAPPVSVGVDTWGVDFGLIGEDGSLLALPRSYRDPRASGAMESFLEKIPRAAIYRRTGIQFLPFNSLYQLYAMTRVASPLLEIADAILFMPDLFHYFLTGRKATEFTFATTTQMVNVVTRTWDDALVEAAGLDRRLLQEIVEPGTDLGPVRDDVRRETGLAARVVAVGTHDTASAVAAVPAASRDFAYISSGTWSLVGIETEHPIVSDEALHGDLSNEGGVGRTYRVLKNVMGLWLVQGCRMAWGLDGPDAYARLTDAAGEAGPARALVDPDDPTFFNPPDMPEAIRAFCVRTGQPPPETYGQIVRCVLESLAHKYRVIVEQMERIRGREVTVVHVIGGGSRNEILGRLTADIAARPVEAGPDEATVIGNLLVQAQAAGRVGCLAEARAIVRRSFPPVRYEPKHGREHETAHRRFREILAAARP